MIPFYPMMNKWWWQKDCQLSCTGALNINNTRSRARTRTRIKTRARIRTRTRIRHLLIPSYLGTKKCLPQRDCSLSCTDVLCNNSTRSWARTRTRSWQFASKNDPSLPWHEQRAVAEGLPGELPVR
jgi:hypothetical protein